MSKMDYKEYSRKLKELHPEWKERDDYELAKSALAESPQYKDRVSFASRYSNINPNDYISPAKKTPELNVSNVVKNTNANQINNLNPYRVTPASEIKFNSAMSGYKPSMLPNADELVNQRLQEAKNRELETNRKKVENMTFDQARYKAISDLPSNIASGFMNIGSGVYGIADALTTGNENPVAKYINEVSRNNMSDISDVRERYNLGSDAQGVTVQGWKDLLNPNILMQTGSSLLGNMTPILMSGGAGAAANAPVIGGVASAGVGGLQTFGNLYPETVNILEEKYGRELTDEERKRVANITGIASGVSGSLDAIPVLRELKRLTPINQLAKQGLKEIGLSALKQAGEEGGTEFLQSLAEQGGQKYLGANDNSIAEMINQAGLEGALGGISGGAIDVPISGINNIKANKQEQLQLQNDISDFNNFSNLLEQNENINNELQNLKHLESKKYVNDTINNQPLMLPTNLIEKQEANKIASDILSDTNNSSETISKEIENINRLNNKLNELKEEQTQSQIREDKLNNLSYNDLAKNTMRNVLEGYISNDENFDNTETISDINDNQDIIKQEIEDEFSENENYENNAINKGRKNVLYKNNKGDFVDYNNYNENEDIDEDEDIDENENTNENEGSANDVLQIDEIPYSPTKEDINEILNDKELINALNDKQSAQNKLVELYNEANKSDKKSKDMLKYEFFQNMYNHFSVGNNFKSDVKTDTQNETEQLKNKNKISKEQYKKITKQNIKNNNINYKKPIYDVINKIDDEIKSIKHDKTKSNRVSQLKNAKEKIKREYEKFKQISFNNKREFSKKQNEAKILDQSLKGDGKKSGSAYNIIGTDKNEYRAEYNSRFNELLDKINNIYNSTTNSNDVINLGVNNNQSENALQSPTNGSKINENDTIGINTSNAQKTPQNDSINPVKKEQNNIDVFNEKDIYYNDILEKQAQEAGKTKKVLTYDEYDKFIKDYEKGEKNEKGSGINIKNNGSGTQNIQNNKRRNDSIELSGRARLSESSSIKNENNEHGRTVRLGSDDYRQGFNRVQKKSSQGEPGSMGKTVQSNRPNSEYKTISTKEYTNTREKISKLARERRRIIDICKIKPNDIAYNLSHYANKIANRFNTSSKKIKELMTFLREANKSELNNPDNILPNNEEYKYLKDLYNKLGQKTISDIKEFVDKSFSELDNQWEQYKQNRNQNITNRENYILHKWKGMPDNKGILETGSNSEKLRTFNTYKEGLEYKGEDGYTYKPETLDAVSLLKMHSDDIIERIANNHFVNNLGENIIPTKLDENGNKIIDYDKISPEYEKSINSVLNLKNNIKKEESKNILVKGGKKAINGLQKINNILRRIYFMFNFFHHSELSASQESFGKGLKAFIPYSAIPYQIKSAIAIFKSSEKEKQNFMKEGKTKNAIKYGVQLGTQSDFKDDYVDKIIDKKNKNIAKQFLNNFNDALWFQLHDKMKVDTFNSLIESFENKYKKKNEELPERVKYEIGQFINDSFGGQNFDTLEISNSALKKAKTLLLSPDWNLSTLIRQTLSITSSESTQKILNKIALSSKAGYEFREFCRKVGIGSISNDIEGAGVRGQMSRLMFAKALIQVQSRKIIASLILLAVNTALHDEDNDNEIKIEDIFKNNQFNKDWIDYIFPDIPLGKDDKIIYEDGEPTGEVEHNKGKWMYYRQGKQFREAPELFVDGLWSIVDKTCSKASPVLSKILTLGFAKYADKYGDEKIKSKYGWKKDIKNTVPFTDVEYPKYLPSISPFSLSDADKKFNKLNKGIVSTFSSVKKPNQYKIQDEIISMLKKGNGNINNDEFSRRLEANGLKSTENAYDYYIKNAIGKMFSNKNSSVNKNRDAYWNVIKALRDYGYDDYEIQSLIEEGKNYKE